MPEVNEEVREVSGDGRRAPETAIKNEVGTMRQNVMGLRTKLRRISRQIQVVTKDVIDTLVRCTVSYRCSDVFWKRDEEENVAIVS
jgi:methyl-accepting chemotaxis protein